MKFDQLFSEQIKLQHTEIRSSKVKGLLLLLSGAALIVYAARRVTEVEVFKLGFGFLTSGVSVVLFRDVTQRKERVISFTHLRTEFERFEVLPQEEQQELRKIAMDVLRDGLKR